MTVQEIRESIRTLTNGNAEMRIIEKRLDKTLNLPINEVFQKMILLDELRKRMKSDIVQFSYSEPDGTIVKAFGTRDVEVSCRHEGTVLPTAGSWTPGDTFPFYDIERQTWRSFRYENLLDINRGYTV